MDVRLIPKPLFRMVLQRRTSPPRSVTRLYSLLQVQSRESILYIFDNLEHVLFRQQRRHFDSTLSVADVVWNCVGHSLCLAHFQSRARIFRQIIVNLCCIENIENRYLNRVIFYGSPLSEILHALIIFGIQIH